MRGAGSTLFVTTAWVALLGGLVAFALSKPSRDSQGAGPTRKIHKVPEGTRDVLTGRKTRDDGSPEPLADGIGSPQQPLKLAFIPPADAGKANAVIDKMLAWLRRRTGYAIEGSILRNYGLAVEQIVQGECDIAFLTAASYARARYATENNDNPDDDLVAFLAAVRQGNPEYPGSDLAYRAALIVHRDSPLQSVEELTDQHTVAVGNPTSGASYVLPSALFNQLGLKPRFVPSGGYMTIITAVMQRSVDVGCIWWSSPNKENPRNDARITVSSPDVFDVTRIIGFTHWIPNEPVVARKALPDSVRRNMARALTLYVNTKAQSEEGRRELELVGNIVGYIPATNDDFGPLLETIQRAFAHDPEGRADYMRGSK